MDKYKGTPERYSDDPNAKRFYSPFKVIKKKDFQKNTTDKEAVEEDKELNDDKTFSTFRKQ